MDGAERAECVESQGCYDQQTDRQQTEGQTDSSVSSRLDFFQFVDPDEVCGHPELIHPDDITAPVRAECARLSGAGGDALRTDNKWERSHHNKRQKVRNALSSHGHR